MPIVINSEYMVRIKFQPIPFDNQIKQLQATLSSPDLL